MDPGTGLTILGTALGTGKVLEKLLGPTAEYLGDGLRHWTQRRVENVDRILGKAAERLGAAIEEPGAVPPRILKAVLDEGSYSDDELVSEYYAGVLASSRSEEHSDDRGVFYLDLVSRLSTYQLRTHYIYYRLCRRLLGGRGLRFGHDTDRSKIAIYIPLEVYWVALGSPDVDANQLVRLMVHSYNGLSKESLLDDSRFSVGSTVGLRKEFDTEGNSIDQPGGVFLPTLLGADLYLWAHNMGDSNLGKFLETNEELGLVGSDVTIPDGAKNVA